MEGYGVLSIDLYGRKGLVGQVIAQVFSEFGVLLTIIPCAMEFGSVAFAAYLPILNHTVSFSLNASVISLGSRT